jgi:hypothetical protein
MQIRKAGMPIFAAVAALFAMHAQTATAQDQSHVGAVLEGDLEVGGDNVAKVFFTNGDSQTIKAGQGGTLAVGAHVQPAGLPLDFTATVGYKFVTTAASNANLGIDRVVFKFTGAYLLPHGLWVDAGPVWHTAVKFKGDGYLPDVNFDDAIGGTVGFGWKWIGVRYTDIHYKSDLTGTINASNGGVTLLWKF